MPCQHLSRPVQETASRRKKRRREQKESDLTLSSPECVDAPRTALCFLELTSFGPCAAAFLPFLPVFFPRFVRGFPNTVQTDFDDVQYKASPHELSPSAVLHRCPIPRLSHSKTASTMAPIRLAHVPHSKSTSALPSKKPSLLIRLFKLLFTIYLLSAVLYTFSHLFLLPFSRFLFSPSPTGVGTANGPVGFGTGAAEELALSSAEKARASAAAAARLAALGIPPEIPVRPLPDGSAGFNGGGGARTGKKPLKGAAVDSEEVKAEDAGSLWGKKKAGSHHHHVVVSSPAVPKHVVAKTADGAIIPPRAAVDGFDPSLSFLSWHAPEHQLSRPAFLSLAAKAKLSPLDAMPASVRKAVEPTSEDFFISKAFGESLGPSKVVPFYYRATGPNRKDGSVGDGPEKEDITITTLITSNRFKVFEKLVEHYQGRSPLARACLCSRC